VTFLALLELMRLKQLVVLQAAEFGEIEIREAPAPVLIPPAATPAAEPIPDASPVS
jgi:chromatin segregation and condensation protein Rec8/ScpA/Scc1 (kleisin family)